MMNDLDMNFSIGIYIGKIENLLKKVFQITTEGEEEEEEADKKTLQEHLTRISEVLKVFSDDNKINKSEIDNMFKEIDDLERIILQIGEKNE